MSSRMSVGTNRLVFGLPNRKPNDGNQNIFWKVVSAKPRGDRLPARTPRCGSDFPWSGLFGQCFAGDFDFAECCQPRTKTGQAFGRKSSEGVETIMEDRFPVPGKDGTAERFDRLRQRWGQQCCHGHVEPGNGEMLESLVSKSSWILPLNVACHRSRRNVEKSGTLVVGVVWRGRSLNRANAINPCAKARRRSRRVFLEKWALRSERICSFKPARLRCFGSRAKTSLDRGNAARTARPTRDLLRQCEGLIELFIVGVRESRGKAAETCARFLTSQYSFPTGWGAQSAKTKKFVELSDSRRRCAQQFPCGI